MVFSSSSRRWWSSGAAIDEMMDVGTATATAKCVCACVADVCVCTKGDGHEQWRGSRPSIESTCVSYGITADKEKSILNLDRLVVVSDALIRHLNRS